MQTRTPTYQAWRNMRQRCLNPNHPHWASYGGRGIAVCDRWSSFERFLADMGARPEGLTLDRIDNDGNYEPGNCRWATKAAQQQNTRRTKLTPESVAWIRSGTGFTRRQMAARLGVSSTTVTRVIAGAQWT